MSRAEHPLVYSSSGSHGPAEIVPSRTRLRLSLESKGRRGKSVTIVSGLPAHPAYCQALLSQLKAHCGAGGALKDGALEIQGDQRNKVQAYLERLGFQVSRAGG
ncbi:MAG: translation initiation factor [SAR324 cluster bacterium]